MRTILSITVSVLAMGVLATSVFADQKRSSVLLFTADDLHAESVGVFDGLQKGLTPRLDRFAAEGMIFDRAHVNAAICAPSRAVILTGRYSHRSGAMGFMKAREDVPDLVTTLRGGGYLAGILGKLTHSTPKRSMTWDYHFDRGGLGNGRDPAMYYRRSKTFFERCTKEGKPFFFMVNSHDPHRPYCNPKKLLNNAAMPSRVYKPQEVVVPGFLPDLPGVREELSHYLNSTRRLDDTFGRVMDALQESGFASSTIVVFLSDNGIAVPFAKCNTWFHSTRTPFIVRWPGVVKPGGANREHFVSGIDLFPTFLDVTGVRGPGGLDGRSIVPLLRGGSQDARDHVFTQIDKKSGGDAVPMRCVQNARFGYMYNPFSDGKHVYRNANEGKCMKAMNQAAVTDASVAARIRLFRYRVPEELYDLREDPDCLVNLIDSAERRGVLEDLRGRLESWMQRTGDPMLEAFRHRDDRAAVDGVMVKTYGPRNTWRGKRRQRRQGTGKKPAVGKGAGRP